MARSSSERMATTNRKYASERMRERNPMRRKDVREKVSLQLRVMGWMPSVRGGNGHGPTVPEQLLACALGWEMGISVPTRQPRGSGYPTHYKIDVGNRALKIAIEVDGTSHQAIDRRRQDRKKEALLAGLGWSVLRFSNRDVTERLAECVRTVLSTISR